jgi:hypothetical protein
MSIRARVGHRYRRTAGGSARGGKANVAHFVHQEPSDFGLSRGRVLRRPRLSHPRRESQAVVRTPLRAELDKQGTRARGLTPRGKREGDQNDLMLDV